MILVFIIVVTSIFLSRPGGLNLVRTATNKSTSDFERSGDPARGYVYSVRPARASWLSVLIPLPLFAFLAVWGVFSSWIAYAAIAGYFIFAGMMVLPGARHRAPAEIAVSRLGIDANGYSVPFDQIAELEVINVGLKLAAEPEVARPGGVPTASLVGRWLGRRQADRSFAVTLRPDGQAQPLVLAGGLKEATAVSLQRDISAALGTLAARSKP